MSLLSDLTKVKGHVRALEAALESSESQLTQWRRVALMLCGGHIDLDVLEELMREEDAILAMPEGEARDDALSDFRERAKEELQ